MVTKKISPENLDEGSNGKPISLHLIWWRKKNHTQKKQQGYFEVTISFILFLFCIFIFHSYELYVIV